LQHYVEKGPGIKPIRPEFLAATLSDLAADDAMFFADTGTACIWLARHVKGGTNRRLFGSFSWASMANAAPNAFGAQLAYPGRQTIALCGDGGFTMLALGDLLTRCSESRRWSRSSSTMNRSISSKSRCRKPAWFHSASISRIRISRKSPRRWAPRASASKSRATVREGLAVALAHKGGPVVVDVVVDPYALSLPSHLPFHAAKGFTLSLAKQVLSGNMDALIKTIEHNTGLV